MKSCNPNTVWTPQPVLPPIYKKPRTDEETRLVVLETPGIEMSLGEPEDETTIRVTTDEPTDDTTLAVNVIDPDVTETGPQDVGASFFYPTVWKRVMK